MKTLKTMLTKNPGYLKWGAEKLATLCNISVNTVRKYRKTPEYKEMYRNYIN